MSNSAYFNQIEQNIRSLISEKKFNQAYSLCKELKAKFPHELETINRFEKLVEEEVREENSEIIKERLHDIDELWDQEKYLEILKLIKELLKIDPQNGKLHKQYQRAQVAYKEKIEKQEGEFQKAQNERLGKLLEENPNQMLEELFILERNNIDNVLVRKLAFSFRDKLIEKKIKEKQDLLYSDKYDAIGNFVEQLKKIDPKNSRIAELEVFAKQRTHFTQISQKEEFIYGGNKHLDTLMKLKKFDKAIQVAKELLNVDAKNTFAQKTLESAQEKFYSQTRELTIESIKSNSSELKEEYQKDKDKFVKL